MEEFEMSTIQKILQGIDQDIDELLDNQENYALLTLGIKLTQRASYIFDKIGYNKQMEGNYAFEIHKEES